MEFVAVRQLWGVDDWASAFPKIKANGYFAVETCPGLLGEEQRQLLRSLCEQYGLKLVFQIHTGITLQHNLNVGQTDTWTTLFVTSRSLTILTSFAPCWKMPTRTGVISCYLQIHTLVMTAGKESKWRSMLLLSKKTSNRHKILWRSSGYSKGISFCCSSWNSSLQNPLQSLDYWRGLELCRWPLILRLLTGSLKLSLLLI